MVATTPKQGVYYGWYMMVAMIFSLGIGYAIYSAGLGPVVTDVQKEFGWTRVEVMAAFSLGSGAIGFTMPVMGWIIDRFGTRTVMIFGGIGLWAFTLMVSYANGQFMWTAGWIGVCFSQVFLTLIPLNKLVTLWFQKRRGLAMGVLASGNGLIGAIAIYLWNFLVAGYGWRGAWFVMAWPPLVVTLLAILLVKDRPEEKGMRIDGAPMSEEERAEYSQNKAATAKAPVKLAAGEADYTVVDAMKTVTLWIFIFGSCLVASAAYIRATQQQPFMEGLGMSKLDIGAALGLTSIIAIPFGFVVGAVADSLGKRRTSILYGVVCIFLGVSIAILAVSTNSTLVWVSLIVVAVGNGMSGTMPGLFIGQFYGPRAYAMVFSVRNFFLRFASMGAPLLAAWMYDTTKSYFIVFMATGVLLGVAAVLLIIAPVPKMKPSKQEPVAAAAS